MSLRQFPSVPNRCCPPKKFLTKILSQNRTLSNMRNTDANSQRGMRDGSESRCLVFTFRFTFFFFFAIKVSRRRDAYPASIICGSFFYFISFLKITTYLWRVNYRIRGLSRVSAVAVSKGSPSIPSRR